MIEAADVTVISEPRHYEAAAKWNSRDCGIIVFPDKAINTPTTVTALLVKGETLTVAEHCERSKTSVSRLFRKVEAKSGLTVAPCRGTCSLREHTL